MVTLMHEQNIICSQTQSGDIAHEQTIICGQLFAGHMVGARPMKRKKMISTMFVVLTIFNWATYCDTHLHEPPVLIFA